MRVLVGRDDAMAAMEQELLAAAEGSRRLVWIEGEAGIGKTSLLRRFVVSVSDEHRVIWASAAELLEAHCASPSSASATGHSACSSPRPWSELAALEEAQRALDELDAPIARLGSRRPRPTRHASGASWRGPAAIWSQQGPRTRPGSPAEVRFHCRSPVSSSQRGGLLRRLGDRGATVAQLRQARQRLADLGAHPFVARCDEELTACGLPSRRASVDPLGLTPSELTVAHLVARGLSNREAAARLYVSSKAVETTSDTSTPSSASTRVGSWPVGGLT